MKRLFGLILCLSLLVSLAVPASAAAGNERLLEYDYIDTVTANLTIDRFLGIAKCDGSVDASGDYDVYVQVSLQKYNGSSWDTLQTWTNRGRGAAEASGRYAIAKGYQYRTYTAGIVYDSNGTIIDSAIATYAETFN